MANKRWLGCRNVSSVNISAIFSCRECLDAEFPVALFALQVNPVCYSKPIQLSFEDLSDHLATHSHIARDPGTPGPCMIKGAPRPGSGVSFNTTQLHHSLRIVWILCCVSVVASPHSSIHLFLLFVTRHWAHTHISMQRIYKVFQESDWATELWKWHVIFTETHLMTMSYWRATDDSAVHTVV